MTNTTMNPRPDKIEVISYVNSCALSDMLIKPFSVNRIPIISSIILISFNFVFMLSII